MSEDVLTLRTAYLGVVRSKKWDGVEKRTFNIYAFLLTFIWLAYHRRFFLSLALLLLYSTFGYLLFWIGDVAVFLFSVSVFLLFGFMGNKFIKWRVNSDLRRIDGRFEKEEDKIDYAKRTSPVSALSASFAALIELGMMIYF